MIKRLKQNFWDYLKATIVLCLIFGSLHWGIGLCCLVGRLMFDAVDVYLFMPLRRINRRDKINEYEVDGY